MREREGGRERWRERERERERERGEKKREREIMSVVDLFLYLCSVIP